VVDVVVLFLISLNLLWLLTDAIVMQTGFGILLLEYSPAFTMPIKQTGIHIYAYMMLYLLCFY
jgi:hypothetical protein